LAQRYLDQAISLQPDQVQAYSLRVEAYFWQQQLGYAIADATLAIYLEPSDPLLLARRAFLFSTIEDWRSALTDLDRAIWLDAANTELYAQAARYASISEQPELAIRYLERGLEAEPENQSLLMQLGDVYYDMDERAQALETYRAYLALAQTPSELVRARVLILERDAG
jgi:tetratricopeptide (TPR) repeat protein